MFSSSIRPDSLRAPSKTEQRLTKFRKQLALAAVIVAFALTAINSIAPPLPAAVQADFTLNIAEHSQNVSVSTEALSASIERKPFSATAGIDTYVRGGTNYDWAKLVLLDGGWPITDSNVTVMLRWMRQENGADSWWTRNNPLNNGLGSGGGGGTGRYANLVIAAAKVAENLHRNRGFAAIEANLAASSSTEVIEQAIWASPWASGHYADGGHWHYTPVQQVLAPAGAWG